MKVFPMEDQKDLIHLIATLKSPAEKSLRDYRRFRSFAIMFALSRVKGALNAEEVDWAWNVFPVFLGLHAGAGGNRLEMDAGNQGRVTGATPE